MLGGRGQEKVGNRCSRLSPPTCAASFTANRSRALLVLSPHSSPPPRAPLSPPGQRGKREATSVSHGERRTPGRPATAAAGLPRHRAGPGGWARARRVRGLCNTSNSKDYKIKILSPPETTTTKTQIPSQSAVASAGRTAHTQRLQSLRTNPPQGEPVPFPLHRSPRSPASPSLGNDFISSDYSSTKRLTPLTSQYLFVPRCVVLWVTPPQRTYY